jgi:predicted nucleotidyltransferase
MTEATEHPAEREAMETSGEVDEGTFRRVLAEVIEVADAAGLPYAVMGGIAASALGRDRWTHDIDLFVRRSDARPLLERFAAAGFSTEERDEDWLYKAYRGPVMTDVIFEIAADVLATPILFDQQMEQRVRRVTFQGVSMPVLAPEDLVVIKALVHREHRARHWFDALGLVAAGGLDWSYLLRRAEIGRRRVLSLLLYAQSDGLEVPDRVVRALLDGVDLDLELDRPADEPAEPYLLAKVRERLAGDPRTAELEVDVSLSAGAVVLTGCVATVERQAALTDAVHDLLPDRAVRNLTVAGPPPPGPRVERLS